MSSVIAEGSLTGGVLDLLSGKMLRKVQDESVRLELCRDEILNHLARLSSQDRSIVREELRTILVSKERETFPALQQIVQCETAQHRQTPLLIAALQAHVPVWLHGDAGSGKTTAAAQAADFLGLPFRFISVCPTTTKSEFLGYRDATGEYRSTAFREIFEGGGLFLIDEIDNGNPSILSVLNTALANDHCAFPDGNIKRHQNCVIVAAANTIGRGADVRYIGRNALDATTLDRFVFIHMNIDEDLECALSGGPWNSNVVTDIAEGGNVDPTTWRETVQRVRTACHEFGLDHLVTPRATLYGIRLAAVGVGKKHLFDLCLWKGLREQDKEKILGTKPGHALKNTEGLMPPKKDHEKVERNEKEKYRPPEIYLCFYCEQPHDHSDAYFQEHWELMRNDGLLSSAELRGEV